MGANDQLRRARVAVAAVFFVNGSVFASLMTRLPALKDDLGLSEGELGLALLCATLGLSAAQLAAGAAVVRWGGMRVMRVIGPAYAASVVLPVLAPGGGTFALGLLALGATNGALDLTMNAEGAEVERRYGRPLMSSLHAAFSFGALAGAAGGALMASLDVAPDTHLVGVAAIAFAVAVTATRHLLPARVEAGASLFARPSRSLAALGVLAFCVLLVEGAVADWSAIYMHESLGTSEAAAAAGLAGFSLTMGIGRAVGDRLTAAVGATALATGGTLLAAVGLGTALAVHEPAAAVAGFVSIGAGLATTFPLVVSAAANRPEAASGAALATVTTAGYSGFMVGPPVIGFVAEATSLRVALLMPTVLCLIAAALSPAIARERTGQSAS